MAVEESDISKKFSLKRILIPVLIGLGVATWLLVSNLTEVRFVAAPEGDYVWVDHNKNGEVDAHDVNEFVLRDNSSEAVTYNRLTYQDILAQINWTWYSTFWMLIALLMVVFRDLGYMYRIRVLTDKQLSWRQSFDVIMLWEFASAITPSVVGGAGVAVFIVNREGVSMGKSTALVLVTALMDELFYLLMVPLVILMVSTDNLFVLQDEQAFFGMTLNTEGIFWMGYGFLFLLTSIIVLGVFYKPQGFKQVLSQLFRLRFLKKWRAKAEKTGDEMIITSKALKGKSLLFWIKIFGATFFSWTARFWVVNFIILAFTSTTLGENLMIYARQLIMWVIMLISPTPGSSGVAEVAFSGFLGNFIPVGFAAALAILWRLMSYYPYLFVGAIILPRWLKRTANRKKAATPVQEVQAEQG